MFFQEIWVLTIVILYFLTLSQKNLGFRFCWATSTTSILGLADAVAGNAAQTSAAPISAARYRRCILRSSFRSARAGGTARGGAGAPPTVRRSAPSRGVVWPA